MKDKPRLHHLISMMAYIDIDEFIIPDFSLVLPAEAMASNFRNDRVFRFNRRNATLNYYGYGNLDRSDIIVRGIQMNDAWINRGFYILEGKVQTKINRKIFGESMKDLKKLILKFNKIEFVDMG